MKANTRVHGRIVLLAALMLAAVGPLRPARAGAQAPPAVARNHGAAASSPRVDAARVAPPQEGFGGLRGYAFERQITERWLNARQKPAFTAPDRGTLWLRVDSARVASAGARSLYLSVARSLGERGDWAELDVASTGRLTGMTLSARPWTVQADGAVDSVREGIARYHLVADGSFGMPESRVWELLPAVHPARFRAGERWSDTINLSGRQGGFEQTLRGRRTATLVRDTLIDQRRLWIVRDSASVRYEEKHPEDARTLDTLAVIERLTTGVIKRRYLYDAELHVFLVRHDTTLLSGAVVLRYSDGRAFRATTRYERADVWLLRDPAAVEAQRGADRAAAEARVGASSLVPSNDVELRLARGEAGVRDSLLARWRDVRDPEERERVYRTLVLFAGNGATAGDVEERIAALAAASGDTVFEAQAALRRLSVGPRPIDLSGMRLLLPLLADPGVALGFGLNSDKLYASAVDGLLRAPPAGEPDSTRWACLPSACRLLAREWDQKHEARLRDLGLLALVLMDPARWSAAVSDRAGAGSWIARRALPLLDGALQQPFGPAPSPLPAPDADWSAWLQWLGGRVPVNVDARVGHALRLYAAKSGRDVLAELNAKRQQSTSDAATLVWEGILLSADAYHPDADTTAARLLSGSAALRTLAQSELRALFRSAARPAPDSLVTTLQGELLDIELAAGEAWPTLEWSAHNSGVSRAGYGGVSAG